MSKFRYLKNILDSHTDKNFFDEKHIKYGIDKPEKTIYIIRREDRNVGLFSNYTYVLGHINYALNKGWLPVIDFENYRNAYSDAKTIGKKNSWEYYFKQPGSIKLDDAYKCSNVVLSSGSVIKNMPNISMDFFNNAEKIDYWRTLAHNFVGLKPEVIAQIDSEWKEKFGDTGTEKVLAVLLRGTDYINLKPSKHPVQPTVEEAIKEIDIRLDSGKYESVFLATEDQYLLEKLENRFGNLLKYRQGYRFKHDTGELLSKVKIKDIDSYTRGLEYLIAIGMLARCDDFWGGRTSGTLGALLLSDGFNSFEVWNRGVYD